jgi:sulfur carrier protein ThiS
MQAGEGHAEERTFLEFRRKVRHSEMLSSSMNHLLESLHFTGKLCVIVQNGQVLKSGYEEGYFRQRNDSGTV